MLISVARAFKFALQDFKRNIWLSFITITIVGLALVSFNFLVGLNFLTDSAIKVVQDKIDVSVYFKPGVSQSQTLDLKTSLESLSEVKEVTYISPDDALAAFKLKHKDNETILKSLEEIKENPLGATLVIKAQTPNDYPAILEIVERPRYQDIIQDKNFDEHKLLISRITAISSRLKVIGLTVSFVFSLIAMLVVFNTIRVIIYTHKEEIGMMKLVGATNGFIRMPYLIEGVLFSVLGMGLILLVWYPFIHFLQPYISTFFESSQLSLVSYFSSNYLIIFGSQLAAVVLLNIIGSWLAVNRYLNV